MKIVHSFFIGMCIINSMYGIENMPRPNPVTHAFALIHRLQNIPPRPIRGANNPARQRRGDRVDQDHGSTPTSRPPIAI